MSIARGTRSEHTQLMGCRLESRALLDSHTCTIQGKRALYCGHWQDHWQVPERKELSCINSSLSALWILLFIKQWNTRATTSQLNQRSELLLSLTHFTFTLFTPRLGLAGAKTSARVDATLPRSNLTLPNQLRYTSLSPISIASETILLGGTHISTLHYDHRSPIQYTLSSDVFWLWSWRLYRGDRARLEPVPLLLCGVSRSPSRVPAAPARNHYSLSVHSASPGSSQRSELDPGPFRGSPDRNDQRVN